MVKTLLANVANVHGRALAHGLEALEHLNVGRRVLLFLLLEILLFSSHIF